MQLKAQRVHWFVWRRV